VVQYRFEYTRRLRVAHVGCGGHSFRNILPCYRYAPVDLVAVCDADAGRAAEFARQFGAERWYTEYAHLLEDERPEAVFLVTGYGPDGRPTYPSLALQALAAGANVWMEKPPAASTRELRQVSAAAATAGRRVMVGLKKVFFPAIRKAKALSRGPDFGPITTLSVRYPQALPPAGQRRDPQAMRGFLDHLCHPASILYTLGGAMRTLYFQRAAENGAVVAAIGFESGAVGALHLAAGISGTSPLERVEIVGRGANLVVENGCRLTYYRPGARGDYGRSDSFIGPDDAAPLVWEPEFSLGQLYNCGLFLLGYAAEIRYFCDCLLNDRPIEEGGLDAAFQATALYEAFQGREGELLAIEQA
jgi:predicted dehydrogenase